MTLATPARPLDRWRIAEGEIRAELARGRKPKDLVCLGCAAKVDLVATVYPALVELKEYLKKTRIKLQPRDDVYLFETDGDIRLERGRYPIADLLAGQTSAVTEDVKRHRPQGIVVLTNFLPMPSREKLRQAFFAFYEAAARADHPFTVGKGHTIQIAKEPEGEYFIVDYVRSSGTRLYGVANNDTISNIDPNLVPSSWVSVFVALNNALNDIFLSGVYKNVRVHPTVDARDPEDVPNLRDSLKRYQDRFGEMGIEMVDCPPLEFRTKSTGATVLGTTDREVPVNQRLLEGQVLLATRPVGDLAPLTDMLIKQALDEDVADLQEMRVSVLSQMLTPNVEAAKIIANRLPMKGRPFDPARHITVCRDMTGPGILAVEELAQDSGTDIYVDDIRMHDDRLADVEMPNPTSGTNGAIILAVMPGPAKEVFRDLQDAGYDPWVIGQVKGKSAEPTIRVNEALKKFVFIRGVKKGIFERSRFVPGEKVGL